MAHDAYLFHSKAAGYEAAGDVFLSNLPVVDVLQPSAVRKLADAYGDLRAAGREGARLAEVGSGGTPRGITWALKDRLAEVAGRLQEAALLLENTR